MTDKSLILKEDLTPIISSIDDITAQCKDIIIGNTSSFGDALILAKGVAELSKLFTENEAIKATILNMQDSPLGFLTDRGPKAVEYAQRSGKSIKSYEYEEVVPCVIEALMNGYRITGKEFFIIAGNFYPGQKGKFRKIIEWPGLTKFCAFNSLPEFKSDKSASVTVWATWAYNNVESELDPFDVKIRVNASMGEDAIVGKALSKLFSRVLMKLSGEIVPDIDENVGMIGMIENENSQKNYTLTEKIKSSVKTEPISNSKADNDTTITNAAPSSKNKNDYRKPYIPRNTQPLNSDKKNVPVENIQENSKQFDDKSVLIRQITKLAAESFISIESIEKSLDVKTLRSVPDTILDGIINDWDTVKENFMPEKQK